MVFNSGSSQLQDPIRTRNASQQHRHVEQIATTKFPYSDSNPGLDILHSLLVMAEHIK